MSPHQPAQSRSKHDLKRLLALGLEKSSQGEIPAQPLPRKVGDYEILTEIGRGGMGVVYQARQLSLNRVVALKMILAADFAGESQRLGFKREAETIAALQHPHIVSIHEVGEFEGIPFYSMDFIDGKNLKEMISRAALPWKEAVRLTIHMARTMQFAHEQGVLHRDLKPQNVMIDGAGQLHLTDFGLARTNSHTALTLTGEALGTPNYMAPEQIEGKADLLTPAMDVYAMGAILFEMLTSVPPFMGANTQEILEKVKYQEALGPRAINGAVPKDLNTICLKCLEKDPTKRYPTMCLLADDLERVLQDRPILARPTSPVEKGWRWCRRNRAMASVVTVAVTVLFIGTILSFWMLNQRRIEAEHAKHYAEQKQAEAEDILKKFLRQKELTTQAESARKQESLLREQAVKTSSQVQVDWARESLSNGDLVEAYRMASAALAGSPQDATAMRIKAAIEAACFNLPASMHWMDRASQQFAYEKADTRIREVLSRYVPTYLKLNSPLQDRELQIAFVTELLSINHPLFTPAAQYLRQTNPAILDEKLKPLRAE